METKEFTQKNNSQKNHPEFHNFHRPRLTLDQRRSQCGMIMLNIPRTVSVPVNVDCNSSSTAIDV